jgi:hypothetical protein
MAHRIGLVGMPNTGKSFSRVTLKEPKKTFVISPSQKMTYLKDEEGKALPQADITTPDGSFRDVVVKLRQAKPIEFLNFVMAMPDKSKVTLTGNHIVVRTLQELAAWTHLVNELRPEIHTLILPDFTHYISSIIGSSDFIKRKSGGEAFQRFWELAGDALNGYLTNIDFLREDLIVVTEFHSEYVEEEDSYRIFVPAGKMLQEKFIPDSYYDFLFYTKVIAETVEPDYGKRFKFVVNRSGRYPARSGAAFAAQMEIPNDLQLVIDSVRKYIGIPLNN